MESQSLSYSAAFIAGLLSFFSPCVLPLLPVYTAMLTGTGKFYIFNLLTFFTGFVLTFVALGATASLLGQWAFEYQDLLRRIGALVMILMGLQLLGWLPLKWLKLKQEYRPLLQQPRTGPIGTFVMGVGFMVGWTPCVGPILGSIFILAGTSDQGSQGIALLLIYAFGFLLPFVILSYLYYKHLVVTRRLYQYLPELQKLSGLLLVLMGIFLYWDWLQKGLSWLW